MNHSPKSLLHFVLNEPFGAVPTGVDDWWRAHQKTSALFGSPFAGSAAMAFRCEHLAWVFASAYHGALRELFGAPADRRLALAVTEAGGVHPRYIEAEVDPERGVTGTKTFVTFGSIADVIIVLAHRPGVSGGRKDFRLLEVPGDADGVIIEEVHHTPFAPEVPHARIRFDGVVDYEELADEGWKLSKKFRTTEDLFVFGAVLAFFIRLSRRTCQADRTRRFASLLAAAQQLSEESPAAAATHVALDGLHSLATAEIEEFEWDEVAWSVARHWERDRGLLDVASTARRARSKRATAELSLEERGVVKEWSWTRSGGDYEGRVLLFADGTLDWADWQTRPRGSGAAEEQTPVEFLTGGGPSWAPETTQTDVREHLREEE